MYEEQIAVCGNNCRECPRYTATASGDPSELETVAALWHEMGFRDTVVSPDEISCNGCDSSSPCVHGVRQCAEKRGIDSCGLCSDYPCILVEEMFEKAIEHKAICKEQWGLHYSVFKRAFFNKKENLDIINNKKA